MRRWSRRDKPPSPARLRLAYPYMVKVRPPLDGASERLDPIIAAAAGESGERLEMWSQDLHGDNWIVFGFRHPDAAERLRGWILEQGWGELLQGGGPRRPAQGSPAIAAA